MRYNLDDIHLRSIDGSDASMVLNWENDRDIWRVSDRNSPMTLWELSEFIVMQNSVAKLDELDQFRYIIALRSTGRPIGTIDLYEIDWDKESAFIGILIANKEDRKKNAGFCALERVLDLMFNELSLTKVYARIQPDNVASIRLFEKAGFNKKQQEKFGEQAEAEYIEFFCDLEKKW